MPPPKKQAKSYRSILFWMALGVVLIILWSLLQTAGTVKKEPPFSEFLIEVESDQVEEVTIAGDQINGKYVDGTTFKTFAPANYDDLVNILREHKVSITVKSARSPWFSYLFTWFPIIILILFWVFFMRQMQSGGNKALSFGKSRAKLFSGVQKKFTFKDVAGVEDEIDAVGRQRGAGLGGGHDEREQTLNQLLVEMDGFDSNEGVILIAATNRPDILDTALLRPGRFDRRVVVNMPDVKGREDILKVHIKNIPLDKEIDLSVLARSTPGFSGADLANLVNEAALLAARLSQEKVTMMDMESAKDKVLMGVERKSMIISEEEKKNTSYHEAGHALVASLLPDADPIHKVTIIPRGLALGTTQQLPLDDRYTYSKEYLEAQLSVLMAGRASEKMLLGKTTTGAANDFEKATEIARKMVCQWGMSDLGPVTFGERDDLVFLGKDLAMHKNFSEKTAELIDAEVKKIINRSFNRTKELLEKHRDKLIDVAKALLEKEVLTSEELEEIIKGKKIATGKKASLTSKVKEEKPKKEPKKIQPLKKPDLVKA